MKLRILTLGLTLVQYGHALLEESFISFEPADGSIPIHAPIVIQDAYDPETVKIAVRSLVEDWKEITGTAPVTYQFASNITRIVGESSTSAIIPATANSTLISYLEKAGKIDVSDIRGKWETFKTLLVSDPIPGVSHALVIAGSDKRGTAFGIYTLSEQSGQSPLHFWADVPATKHDAIYALPKTTVHGEPSVKYRGLFINDEAPALTGWWAKHSNRSDYTLDSKFYSHVFDLIVRLKGNFIWPAMWASFVPEPGRMFFVDDPKNQQLADDYGIVVSTSHHEPMQRNSNEWTKAGKGVWNWLENKDNIVEFMEEGVRRAGTNESYFTLGMRGENDGPIEADDPAAVLKEVMQVQRELIEKYHDSVSGAPQVWTAYKEVQAYYEAGLVPPEDVTIMFADDNWGTLRRLPTSEERKRSGGIGIYHHLAYVGRPKSYKWQNTNNLPKLYKELYQAYERGARQIWIFNVEDIKPLEVPYSFAMDLAWNTSIINFETFPTYLKALATRDFGKQVADEAALIMQDHSHLLGFRRYEMISPDTYSIMNYHEADRIREAWDNLAERARSLYRKLPDDRKAGFFHLALWQIVTGANYHSIMVKRALNLQYAKERRNSANDLAHEILAEFDTDWDLALDYEKLSGGKWAGMMLTPKFDYATDSWKPASRDVISNISFVQKRQNFDYGFGNLGIYAEASGSAEAQGRICASLNKAWPTNGANQAKTPTLTRYGQEYVTVDLFHRGDFTKSISWVIDVPYSWLKFSQTTGVVTGDIPDQRVNITVDWAEVPAGFKKTFDVQIRWEPEPYFDNLRVTVYNDEAPSDFQGFPAANGIVSIEGPHFQRSSDGDVKFEHIPHLGSRSDSGSISLRPYQSAWDDAINAKEAWVEYDFYIFGDKTGQVNATIYINSALDTDPSTPMEYSLGIDGGESTFTALLSKPSAVGELPPEWDSSVADNVWAKKVALGNVGAGKHTLRWKCNSPELYLEKIVLAFDRTVPLSYLGPPETRQV